MTRLRTLFTGLTIASALVLSGAPALGQTPATPKVEKPAATLPPAQEILDRHVKAAGGREAFEAIDSTHVRGSIAIPANGMSGSFEAFAARPNKTFMKMSLAGIGDTTEGFDGTTAWAMSPMTGPMVVTGEELEQKKFDADFNAMLDVASRYESMKTVEQTTFEGRPVYKLELTRKGGGIDTEYYDVETGLKAGSVLERKNPMGTISVTTALSDYRKFGAIMQPTTLSQSLMGAKIVMTITSVEANKVDPAVFELPAEIKAIVK
jgi:hypothetical protein